MKTLEEGLRQVQALTAKCVQPAPATILSPALVGVSSVTLRHNPANPDWMPQNYSSLIITFVFAWWRAPVPVPLCPPQISHALTRDRTRASAVRDWWLTASAMTRPIITGLHNVNNEKAQRRSRDRLAWLLELFQPVRKAHSLTTFMYRLSWNPEALTSWNPQGLSRDCFTDQYNVATKETQHMKRSVRAQRNFGARPDLCVQHFPQIVTPLNSQLYIYILRSFVTIITARYQIRFNNLLCLRWFCFC